MILRLCSSTRKNSGLLLFFIFLIAIFPILHNCILWLINWLIPVPAAVNLFLLGWKDAALTAIGLLLLFPQRKWFIINLALFVIAFVAFKANIIKYLFEPFMVTVVLVCYRNSLYGFLKQHQKRFAPWLIALLIIILIIGYADYFYRLIYQINGDTFFNYPYLLSNNKFRCAKELFQNTTVSQENLESCLHTPLNFYKIGLENGIYYDNYTLFLPIGDSVVFSLILFYFLCWYTTKLLAEKLCLGWKESIFICVLLVSIVLTFSRVTALFSILTVLFFGIGKIFQHHKNRVKVTILLISGLVFYLYFSQYLILSIFDKKLPSNIGHLLENAETSATDKEPSLVGILLTSRPKDSHLQPGQKFIKLPKPLSCSKKNTDPSNFIFILNLESDF